MGKNREHNIKVLENVKIGLSAENKRKANNIINMYQDGIINNYKQAQNFINKLESRGKGQEKLEKKVKEVKKSKIISSIVRRNSDKPLSFTFLTLNTRERQFKEIQPDIFPTVLKEAEHMLKTKQSMKLGMTIHFDIYRELAISRNKKDNKDYIKKLTKTLVYPSRLVIEKNDDGSESFLEVRTSDPYSTSSEKVIQSNIQETLLNKFGNLDITLESLASQQGSEWNPYKFHRID